MKNGKPKQDKYSQARPGNTGTQVRDRHKETEKASQTKRAVAPTDSFIDEMKNDLMAFFQRNDGASFTQEQLLEHFNPGDRKTKLLLHGLIHELADEGALTKQPDGSYRANQASSLIEGVVDHVNAKFAFVIPATTTGVRAERNNDIWVSTDDLNGAVDGDRVRVRLLSGLGNRSRRIEGEVVDMVERGRTELVGRLEMSATYGFVVPDSRKVYEDIFIPKEKLGGASDDDKVIVRIVKYPTGRIGKQRFEGEVITVLGAAGENNTEMHAILAEFGLPIDFPREVEAEADAIPTKILKKDLTKRRDMRGITTFTIDPADAKDFDDALSVQMLDNGNYEIGVHIADVTHYVQPGSLLETEAYKRATSVYLVDRVVPMLPEKLSNGLCSLRPNEDKLTFSAVFELTPDARIAKEWFGRTVIHSDRRFSYEEAQDVLTSSHGDYLAELRLLNELAGKLRDERFKNGAINFDTVEVRFNLDENGVPLSVYPKLRQDTNKLIEEFMLLANKRVAEYVHLLSKQPKKGRSADAEENTMVYRVHEGPDPDRLKQFADFAGRVGYKLAVDDEHLSGSMNRFLASIEGKPEANMLSQLAVRTMSKARYSTDDLGHFGLAFRRYSHFTSPIRRYPDMMAHRLLQHYLDKGKPAEREPLEDQCKHASAREKMASDAERASIKYKQVEFMALMAPDRTFEGVISGVTEFGIFVEITENNCEGLVRMQDLSNDFYEFDKENYRVIGSRGGKIYTFGDQVVVRVKETNLARRSMDFALVSDNAGHATHSGSSRAGRAGAGQQRGGGGRSRSGSGQPSASRSSNAPKAKRTQGPAPKGENRRGGKGRR